MRRCEIRMCNRKYYKQGFCEFHYGIWWENRPIQRKTKKITSRSGNKIKQYKELSPEQQERRAEGKQWRKENEESISEYRKKYYYSLKGRMARKAYIHAKRLPGSVLTGRTIQRVYEENIKIYGVLTCELCFKPIKPGEDSLEHFIPLSKGGTNKRNNLGIAHGDNSKEHCNRLKRAKTLNKWLDGLEKLYLQGA